MLSKLGIVQLITVSFFMLNIACSNHSFGPEDRNLDSKNNKGLDLPDNNNGENGDATNPSKPSPPDKNNPNQNPSDSEEFTTLPNGLNLSDILVRGSSLSITRGRGARFSEAKKNEYLRLKRATQNEVRHKVQWTFMNLDTHQVIDRSRAADKKIFGASSSKIYVAAALLVKEEGDLNSSQIQKMADMLVVSSNSAWTELQREIGDGSSNRGREFIHNFTQEMGYPLTRGFQGYWGDLHGNELVPDESVEMLYDTYHNNYTGAETLWKIMYTCRTGSSKGLKYIPQNIFVGGKTGTYSGPTENPENGQRYTVQVRNHLLVFNVAGVQYGLAIFANDGKDESVALLAGGLIREYTALQ